MTQTVNRNTDANGFSGECVAGNEKYISGNERKEDPCYIVAEHIPESCPAIVWKAELKTDEIQKTSKK